MQSSEQRGNIRFPLSPSLSLSFSFLPPTWYSWKRIPIKQTRPYYKAFLRRRPRFIEDQSQGRRAGRGGGSTNWTSLLRMLANFTQPWISGSGSCLPRFGHFAHKLCYERRVCAYCLEFAQIWGQMWTAAHWLLAPGSPRTGPSIVVVQETRDCSFLYQTIILFN